MAFVQVDTHRENSYQCKIVFEYQTQTISVEYLLTTTMDSQDFINFDEPSISATLDFYKMARRLRAGPRRMPQG